MNVPEINEVKSLLESLKNQRLIKSWELPYENLLTRRSAAIFFLTPESKRMEEIASQLSKYPNFSFRENTEKKLSTMEIRVTFSQEELEKNRASTVTAN